MDQFVYLSGGSLYENPPVYGLDIREKKWTESAPMTQARRDHSSCCVGDHLYVMYGYNIKRGRLDSIESLDLRNKERASWQQVIVDELKMNATAICAINKSEIMILGGYSSPSDY